MSLADRATSGPPPDAKGRPCSVGVLLATLAPDERAALDAMLAPGSGWSHAQVARALDEEGHRVGYQTIGTHRRGQCRCRR